MTTNNKDLTEDLLKFIEGEEAEEFGTLEEGEVITTAQANYFIKKVKEIREEKEAIVESSKEQIKNYTEKVEEWKNSRISKLEPQEQYLETMIRSYASEQLENSNKRSLELIEGTIGFRSRQPSYNYDDEKAIEYIEKHKLPYVRNKATLEFYNTDDQYKITDNNELVVDGKAIGHVKLDKSVDKMALKKDVEVTDGKAHINNEIIDGLEVQDREDTFTIK